MRPSHGDGNGLIGVTLQGIIRTPSRTSSGSALLDQNVQNLALVFHGAPHPNAAAMIRTTTSSRCHRLAGALRRRRMFAAMSGPKCLTQHRIASLLTSIPRCANISSTSRRLNVNRKWNQTASLMTSLGGTDIA